MQVHGRIRRVAMSGVLVLVLGFSILAALAWQSHGMPHPGHRHVVAASGGVPGIWML
jgi:hypothetical protein